MANKKDIIGTPFTIPIRYITKVIEDEDKDKFPQYSVKKVSGNYIRVYDSALVKFANISKCARLLIDFLGFEMDAEAMIFNNPYIKTKFRKSIKAFTEGKVNYSDATINIAFSELKRIDLLIDKGKGAYKVNPEYIYRNADMKRSESIRAELEDNIKEESDATLCTSSFSS